MMLQWWLEDPAMPAQPSWFVRVPDMLSILRDDACPQLLDRAALEVLFGVRRRQAIRMMAVSGGYQVGRTFLVKKEGLVAFLEGVAETGLVERAVHRKNRILADLNASSRRAHARELRIPTAPDVLGRRPANLPKTIEVVAPGKLQITFRDTSDLLSQVVELTSAALNDLPELQRMLEGR
jgi:hypothetical protein